MAAAWLVVRPYLPLGTAAYIQAYGGLPVPANIPDEVLLGVWPRWDAVHYLNLAMRGYFAVSPGDSVFYPLYPALVRVAAPFTGNGYILAGLLVSSLAAVAALACLYRLAESYYGSQAARWSVLALSIYPTALFLVAPFTESLFLALTLGAFLAAYNRKWILAGLLGCLASLTRGPGFLTVVPLGLVALNQWPRGVNQRKTSQALLAGAGLGLTAAGGVAFVVWRSVVGFPSMAETLRRYSGLALVDPLTGLLSALAQWVRVHDLYTTMDLVSLVLFASVCGLLAANPRWRKLDWLAYMVVNLLVFLSKRSVVASSLQSMSRYVLTLFPAFILAGEWLARRGSRARFIYAIVSSVVLVAMTALYPLWVFVG
jgi:hypothetical protein